MKHANDNLITVCSTLLSHPRYRRHRCVCTHCDCVQPTQFSMRERVLFFANLLNSRTHTYVRTAERREGEEIIKGKHENDELLYLYRLFHRRSLVAPVLPRDSTTPNRSWPLLPLLFMMTNKIILYNTGILLH